MAHLMSNIMPTFPVELSDIIEAMFWGYFGIFCLASPKFLHLDVIGGQIKLLRKPASSYIQPCACLQTAKLPILAEKMAILVQLP